LRRVVQCGASMKRSQSAPIKLLSAVAALALASGCGRPTHQQVCGDANGVVVDPQKCEEESRRPRGAGFLPLYAWFYGPYGRAYPPGARLTDASQTPPTGRGVRVAPASRGGFGGSARPVAG
jgi:hypothetical protein